MIFHGIVCSASYSITGFLYLSLGIENFREQTGSDKRNKIFTPSGSKIEFSARFFARIRRYTQGGGEGIVRTKYSCHKFCDFSTTTTTLTRRLFVSERPDDTVMKIGPTVSILLSLSLSLSLSLLLLLLLLLRKRIGVYPLPPNYPHGFSRKFGKYNTD